MYITGALYRLLDRSSNYTIAYFKLYRPITSCFEFSKCDKLITRV